MQPRARVDRKQFLAWTLSSTSALVLGCSAEAVDEPGGGGTSGGGTGGASSGAAGTFSSSGTATGGTFGSSGSGGSSAGGSAGAGGASTAGSAGAGGTTPVAPDCGTKLKVVITANHMHVLQVTLADVTAGVDKAYDTKGASDHPHWVKLTAADFAKLKAGQPVRKLSCNDEHEHEFIINCTASELESTSGIANFCEGNDTCGDTAGNVCPELP